MFLKITLQSFITGKLEDQVESLLNADTLKGECPIENIQNFKILFTRP